MTNICTNEKKYSETEVTEKFMTIVNAIMQRFITVPNFKIMITAVTYTKVSAVYMIGELYGMVTIPVTNIMYYQRNVTEYVLKEIAYNIAVNCQPKQLTADMLTDNNPHYSYILFYILYALGLCNCRQFTLAVSLDSCDAILYYDNKWVADFSLALMTYNGLYKILVRQAPVLHAVYINDYKTNTFVLTDATNPYNDIASVPVPTWIINTLLTAGKLIIYTVDEKQKFTVPEAGQTSVDLYTGLAPDTYSAVEIILYSVRFKEAVSLNLYTLEHFHPINTAEVDACTNIEIMLKFLSKAIRHAKKPNTAPMVYIKEATTQLSV